MSPRELVFGAMDPKPNAGFRSSLHGLPYTDTVASKPPVHINKPNSFKRTASSENKADPQPSTHAQTTIETNHEGHGDFLPASPSLLDSQTSFTNDLHTPTSVTSAPSIPEIRIDESQEKKTDKRWLSLKPSKTTTTTKSEEPFHGLALDIPSGDLDDSFGLDTMKFSKRGSMLVDGKRAGNSNGHKGFSGPDSILSGARKRPTTEPRARTPAKVLSTDEEHLSEKVRSFYAIGAESAYDSGAHSSIANKMGLRWQDALGAGTEASSVASLSRETSTTDIHSEVASQRNGESNHSPGLRREESELAGGIEDWQDVDNADVDRYGFIVPKLELSNGLNRSSTNRDPQRLTRVTTSLQLASETPRRKGTVRRTPGSVHGSVRSDAPQRSPSHRSFTRPTTSPNGNLSRHSTFRSRDRKAVDEAGDMLTLPRTASGLTDPVQSASDDPRARRKEIEREEKWRKMAKTVSSKKIGGGMAFEFNVNDPKLIERTWKGIPDKWRATAWHAFLSASAKKRPGSPTDDDLSTYFSEYQIEGSPDDVQIDIDVPRTISSHIMFRRRYRGGQRLLFRVLHAMSLHFPDTGYVQGMAALAATLLAYYEEEKAFIMLVRLWELRGLDKLYKSGFAGLMAALDDFEKSWLSNGELAKKLADVNITPTAYGTRWYLTLFNYSIPFPAQLRVWDVFMLLGDDLSVSATEETKFGSTLDILHATSAALIDGMRDILLEADFEEAMKVLTSWIPIRDEDLLMRVAKAEWKVHRRKA